MKHAQCLPTIEKGQRQPTLVLMHFFGSGKSEWKDCIELIAEDCRCIALDLPGFGDASGVTGFEVDQMVDAVEATLVSLKLEQIILVGHSFSGKVAAAIAARRQVKIDGLILVAPSPPAPEPISDQNRMMMRAMIRDRACAEQYLDGITAKPLKNPQRETAIAEFIRCSPVAWLAWLNAGSLEDWTVRIGVVDCPTLIITGSDDRSLAAPVQKCLTTRHFRHVDLAVIPGCGHVPPLESPAILSTLILVFVGKL